MTDAEKRSLKCFLTNVLEPAHKFHTEAAARQKEAIETVPRLSLSIAKEMHMYHMGKAEAFATAIADFKELFEEELSTVED